MVEIDKFLKSFKYCESDDLNIKILAEKITSDKKTTEEKAKSIFKWVRDNVKYDVMPLVGAKKVLERKPLAAMCFDKTNLFIAFCRAAGISTRYVFMDCDLKVKTDFPARAKHSAAEVLINGEWIIADPTFAKDTEKLVEISRFGEPTWTKAEKMERSEKLSGGKVFIINLFFKLSPFSKKLKKAIEEARKG